MKICSVCQRCYEDSAASCTQGNHGSPAAARPGTREVVPGYRLDFLLDRDAAGEMYAASRITDGESFVVKLVAPESFGGAQNLRERFQTEVQLAANVNHPNLARVYESGMLDGGEFFIISESVKGKTLRDYLRNDGELSEAAAVTIARQVAEGLEAAHRVGLTHRAVSPSNIILSEDKEGRPSAKVQNFDFGGVGQKIGFDGISGGKPNIEALRYMSPEQYTNQTVNARTDIYSLGVVLFEMLTRRSPFDAPTPEAIFHKPINEQPLAERLSYDTRALVTHILRLSLQKNPTARPQTAANFARQLRHIEQLLSISPASLQNLPSNKSVSAGDASPIPFNDIAETGGSSVEKFQQPQAQIPIAAASAPLTTNSLVLPMPEESEADDIEEETLVRSTPIFQSELIAVKKKEAGAVDSFAAEPILVKQKNVDADSFINESPIRIKKKEVITNSFAAEPISVKRKQVVEPVIPESVVVPVPDREVVRAQPTTQSFINSFEDNHAAPQPAAARRPLLVGIGLVALLALAGLGALLYNRQSEPSAAPPIAAASPTPSDTVAASPQSDEPASAPKDYAAANSGAPVTRMSAPIEKTPVTTSESRKKNQPPLAEMPVNNTSAKQNESLREASALQKPPTIESVTQNNSGETSNDSDAAQVELNASLGKWVSATNARDVNGQMNYYAPKVDAFYLTRNTSQDAVRAEKKRVFDSASAVDIQTSKPEIAVSPDGRTAKMRFRKKYVIKQGQQSRSGEVIQELHWVKSAAGWKIVSERDVKVVNR